MSDLRSLGAIIPAYLRTQVAVWENPRSTPENLSPAEVELAIILADVGIEFEQQYRVGPFYADFYFPEARLVVEVDGRAYHSPSYTQSKPRADYMLAHGVERIIHFAGRSVFQESEGVLRAIRYYLRVPHGRQDPGVGDVPWLDNAAGSHESETP